MESNYDSLKFVPFSSTISSSFWETFSKFKLNELKLNTDPVNIQGTYSRKNKEGIPPLLHVQYDFLKVEECHSGECIAPGKLVSVNTIETFKNTDKKQLLHDVAQAIWRSIISGEAEHSPAILSKFLLFLYADLKKYHYYYWFAFPAFSFPSNFEVFSPIKTLKDQCLDGDLMEKILECLKNSNFDLNFFTLLITEDLNIQIFPLSSYYQTVKIKEEKKFSHVWLAFSDPSSDSKYPGWVLRNLLTLAAVKWKDVLIHSVLALREGVKMGRSTIEDSLLIKVKITDFNTPENAVPSAVGWEKNERGKLGPKFCNMLKTMDPKRVAESAVDLNLKLMKWRLDPLLDLELIKKCRCLLIGAGTLGCNVARALLGWNIGKITFVDSGRVSYSNPARQSLYVFDDCLGENNMKAEIAAKNLKKIYPRIEAEGVVLSVPMPGHPVSAKDVEKVKEDVRTLENLIKNHEVVFLLTDSRESRWLPSLIGAAKNKIVLTAALGFDSFLVMRHGRLLAGHDDMSHGLSTSEDDLEHPSSPTGVHYMNDSSLGCYFCNDVVAPGDSTSDRSLDQQCTVTRPGVSYATAGHIVELLIDILQHPIRKSNNDSTDKLYHSARYYFGRMEQLVTTSPAFKNCSACGPLVQSEYRENGFDFLLKVFNSPKYLEEISGLTLLHDEIMDAELIELSDEDE